MAPIFGKNELLMLEDFIRLAREGEDVQVNIELKKNFLTPKAHPEETEGRRGEIESYLLIGEYTCSVAGEVYKVPKVYAFGTAEESLDTSKLHRNIANERLKRDYQRLKDANIKVEKRYF